MSPNPERKWATEGKTEAESEGKIETPSSARLPRRPPCPPI